MHIYNNIYIQVQAQLFCTKVKYCDFVVYTRSSLHIERIRYDKSYWETNVAKVKHFFDVGIMPELLGRWFSRPPTQSTQPAAAYNKDPIPPNCNADKEPTSDSVKYCYCQGDEHGDMIGCDNDKCVYMWFHLECLHLSMKSLPKSKEWYCPDCRKLDKYKKRRTKT